MIDYGQRRTPILLSDGIHEFGVDCANCAQHIGDFRVFRRHLIETVVHGEHVVLCSNRCLETLQRVWAPSRRVWPVAELLACLAFVTMMLL